MYETAPKTPVHILLVEDNHIDVIAFQRMFQKANLPNPLHVANDGSEALDMLFGRNGKEKLEQPCLILLDINMPRMDGFQVLKELRQSHEEAVRRCIVFMLTTSNRNADRVQAYEQNVAGYFLKDNLTGLLHTLQPYCPHNEFPVYNKN